MREENAKDLDTLWVCSDCGIPSLYRSDIEEHKRQSNHRHVAEFDLETGTMITHYTQKNSTY